MLIFAAVSGIQDFLFEVRETGGGQARALRYRSFRIQLIAECVAERLLAAAGLSKDHVLFNAAAKVCIDAGDLDEDSQKAVRATACDMARRLVHQTHGRLRLAWAIVPSADGFGQAFERGNRRLVTAKLQPLRELATADPASAAWPEDALVLPQTWDADAEAENDTDVGRRLANAEWLSVYRGCESMDGKVEVLGLGLALSDAPPQDCADLIACSHLSGSESPPPGIAPSKFRVRRLARHVPRDEHGDPVEFLHLANKARGASMLGVLKADADSLGQAIVKTLEDATDAKPLQKSSEALDRFFAATLEAEKQRPDSRWNSIYTVFSGGDDLLAVGPWDVVLDFAGHIQSLFDQTFGHKSEGSPSRLPLTISAGIAIIKPRYPIHLAAQQAEDLLEQAKCEPAPHADFPKDQCSALGALWKWKDHETIIQSARQLADWVKAGIIQRGWLHTLLQLAMLRKNRAGPEYKGVHPAVATSRLAYHIARNWPKPGDRDERGRAARAWADALLREFDRFDTTSHCQTIYLPAIVRYALLATRGGTEE